MAASPKWQFKTKFRANAYGWRGSKLAITRLKDAVKEIRAVAKADPVAAGDGCVALMERLWPALQHIDTRALRNVRLYQGDAREILPAFADRSLEKLFVLHPDPWPKQRHHKRRLIAAPFLDEAARLLKPGSELRLATDDEPYLLWMLVEMKSHPAFAWTARTADDWRLYPPDAIETRYAAKARLQGRKATILRYVRR
jgi:tRNA (guanine-N7-)-methyltransferase